MKYLLIVLCLLSGALYMCTDKKALITLQQDSRAEQNNRFTKTLPFSIHDSSHQKNEQDSSKIKFTNRIQDYFSQEKNIVKAYDYFKKEFTFAKEIGALPTLFKHFFSQSYMRYRKNDKLLTDFENIVEELVKSAKNEDNVIIQELYSDHLRPLSVNRHHFHINNILFRKGGGLSISAYRSYSFRGKKKLIPRKYTVEVVAINHDQKFNLTGSKLLHKDTIKVGRGGTVYTSELKITGMYRVRIFNERVFWQAHFQVTDLDGLVKIDRESILVYGSSFKNTIPPPYTVHFLSENGEYFQDKTDSSGLLHIGHRLYNPNEQSLKVILTKGDNIAFVKGGVPRKDTVENFRFYLYNDRPVYRPGNRVYIKGVVKTLINDQELSRASVDSMELIVKDSQGTKIYKKVLSVDEWGQLGDSLQLSSTARQGRYTVGVNTVYTNKAKLDKHSFFLNVLHNNTFFVDAYKKPEFKISITSKKELYVKKEPPQFDIKGEYYFGGPLVKERVTVRFYSQNLYHYMNSRGGLYECEFIPAGEKKFIGEKEITLNNEGLGSVNFTDEIDEDYGFVIAEVIAADKSRRQVRAEKKVKLVEDDVYLDVTLDSWSYKVGENAKIDIAVMDFQGKPFRGSVSLQVKRNLTIYKDTVVELSDHGTAMVSLPLSKNGKYTVEVSYKKNDHSKARFVKRTFQVDRKNHNQWHWERVDISTDKESYTFGDTAHITIKSGANNVSALCVVEGNKIQKALIKKVKDGILKYRIPITKSLTQNISFSMAYSGEKRMVDNRTILHVVDSSALFDVSLTGNKKLKPGEMFTGKIFVKNSERAPVQASFSVALVDESIYDVAHQLSNSHGVEGLWYSRYRSVLNRKGILQLYPRYYSQRVFTTINTFSPSFLHTLNIANLNRMGLKIELPIAYPSWAKRGAVKKLRSKNVDDGLENKFGRGGFASGIDDELSEVEAKKNTPRERSNFKDLAFWNASIVTDKNGEAQLSFKMPDDLTKWRLVIIGNDKKSGLIDFKDSIVTKQDVMIKLQAPRTFVTDDTVTISSVVHNYSGGVIKGKGLLKIKDESTGSILSSHDLNDITLEGNESKRLDWNVIIGKGDSISFYTEFTSQSGSDAESRTYAINPNGLVKHKSYVGILSGNGATEQIIDIGSLIDAQEGTRKMTITVSPSLVHSLFESLEYLTGFPYGCVEQTMSRFLPNLYVASILKKLDMKNDSLEKMIPIYTKKGLERLERFQNSDGGWGWWEYDSSDPRMTALVMNGLHYAQQQNLSTENLRSVEKMLDKGYPALDQFIQKKSLNRDQKVALLFALLHSEKLKNYEKNINNLYKKYAKLSTIGVAQLTQILHKLDRNSDASLLINYLVSLGEETTGAIHWKGSENFRWYSQSEETTAAVLKTLLMVKPKHPLIGKAVAWLSRKKRNGYWVSTKTTAKVIEALSSYVKSGDEFFPQYELKGGLNGKSILTTTVSKESLKVGIPQIIINDNDLQGSPQLKLQVHGTGKLYYSVNLQYVSTENPIKAHDNGIEISRSYKKIVYEKNGDSWEVNRVPFDGKLYSGDEVEVTVTVKSSNDHEHLMIEDFFPSGMEYLRKEEQWYSRWCGYWFRGYTHKEARDDRMVFFLSNLQKGKQTFSYLLRAETPGTFTTLPARAEMMYEPEVSGNSEATLVRILERK